MTEKLRFPRLPVYFDLGQPVHHAEFGTGVITRICGGTITVAFSDQARELDIEDVVTRPQAEAGWKACYTHGANRRLEEGRWLWIVRSLCSGRGEWSAFLRKWGIPRSSAFDLIQRFQQERLAEMQQTSGNRTETMSNSGARNNDHADELNAERRRVVRDETNKREGTTGYKYWGLKIKLPEEIAEDCHKKYEEVGAKEYWLRAAYRFADREDELEETAHENDSSDE